MCRVCACHICVFFSVPLHHGHRMHNPTTPPPLVHQVYDYDLFWNTDDDNVLAGGAFSNKVCAGVCLS